MGDDAGRHARSFNDAVAVYFLDATAAAAFVARWCAGSAVEISQGAFRVRDDQAARRVAADRTRLSDVHATARVRLPARRYRLPSPNPRWSNSECCGTAGIV